MNNSDADFQVWFREYERIRVAFFEGNRAARARGELPSIDEAFLRTMHGGVMPVHHVNPDAVPITESSRHRAEAWVRDLLMCTADPNEPLGERWEAIPLNLYVDVIGDDEGEFVDPAIFRQLGVGLSFAENPAYARFNPNNEFSIRPSSSLGVEFTTIEKEMSHEDNKEKSDKGNLHEGSIHKDEENKGDESVDDLAKKLEHTRLYFGMEEHTRESTDKEDSTASNTAGERVYPSLFHRILCLKAEDLGRVEFYASLYQFAKMCWDIDSLKRPWVTYLLPEIYDPTSPTAEYCLNFYDLYVCVAKHGGSENVTRQDQWNEIGEVLNINTNYVMAIWGRYLQCYEVYANMVKSYFWGFSISPTGSNASSAGRTYEEELEDLRESIRKSLEERAGALVFKGKELHLQPNPKHLLLGTLFLDKEELVPSDSVSVTTSTGSLGVEPYMATEVMEAFRQEVLQIYSRAGQNTIESMDGEIRVVRKWTPPPHPILHQDETGGTDPFLGTTRSGFDDFFSVECLQATRRDRRELLAKYGLTPIDYNQQSDRPQSVGETRAFDQWFMDNGIEPTKVIWKEWMRADPGLRVTD